MQLLHFLPQMNHRSEAVDLLEKMLALNPKRRINAKSALEEPFFKLELDQALSHVDYRDLPARSLPVQHEQALFRRTDLSSSAALLHNPMQQNWVDPCKFH
jgi:serine/threonine protein kinase